MTAPLLPRTVRERAGDLEPSGADIAAMKRLVVELPTTERFVNSRRGANRLHPATTWCMIANGN